MNRKYPSEDHPAGRHLNRNASAQQYKGEKYKQKIITEELVAIQTIRTATPTKTRPAPKPPQFTSVSTISQTSQTIIKADRLDEVEENVPAIDYQYAKNPVANRENITHSLSSLNEQAGQTNIKASPTKTRPAPKPPQRTSVSTLSKTSHRGIKADQRGEDKKIPPVDYPNDERSVVKKDNTAHSLSTFYEQEKKNGQIKLWNRIKTKTVEEDDPPIDYPYEEDPVRNSHNTRQCLPFDEKEPNKAARPKELNPKITTKALMHETCERSEHRDFPKSMKYQPITEESDNSDNFSKDICEYPLHNGSQDDGTLPVTSESGLLEIDADEFNLENLNARTRVSIASSGKTIIGGKHISYSQTTESEGQEKSNLIDTSEACVKQHEKEKPNVKTKGLSMAKMKIEFYRKVVLSSGHGCGKTYIGKLLLQHYSKFNDQFNRPKKPVIIGFPHQWSIVVNPNEDLIILLDDIFGKVTVNKQKLDDWKRLFSDIHTCINNDSSSVFVIITVRENILRQIKNELIQHDLFRDIHKFTVQSYFEEDDKENILKAYLSHSLSKKHSNTNSMTTEGIDRLVDEIVNISTPFAFPLCCVEYVNNVQYFGQGPEFFNYPLEIILPEFRSIYKNDKYTFFLLSLILFSPSQKLHINIMDSDTSESRTIFKNVAEFCNIKNTYNNLIGEMEVKILELEHIYISHDCTGVYFISDVILGAMVHTVGENQIYFLLKHMDLSILLNYTTIYQAKNKEFVIDLRFHRNLINRYLEEIGKGSLKDIVESETMENYAFVEQFVSELVNSCYFKNCLGKPKSNVSLLSLAMTNQPPRHKLLEETIKYAQPTEKGIIRANSKYSKWYWKEVSHVLKCGIELNDRTACLIVTSGIEHLPNDILYTCARCRDPYFYNHFLKTCTWSRVTKCKAKRMRKMLIRQLENEYQEPQRWLNKGLFESRKKSYNLKTRWKPEMYLPYDYMSRL